MSFQGESEFQFKSSDKSTLIIFGSLAIMPFVLLVVGGVLYLSNYNDSAGIGILLILLSELGIFTIPAFLYLYIPTKNVLTIFSNSISFETYKESISFDFSEINSIKIEFLPKAQSGGGSLVDTLVTSTLDAVSESLQGEEEKKYGKFTLEVKSQDKKKKLTFMFSKFIDTFPIIEKISELTSTPPQKSKYKRSWTLKTNS